MLEFVKEVSKICSRCNGLKDKLLELGNAFSKTCNLNERQVYFVGAISRMRGPVTDRHFISCIRDVIAKMVPTQEYNRNLMPRPRNMLEFEREVSKICSRCYGLKDKLLAVGNKFSQTCNLNEQQVYFVGAISRMRGPAPPPPM